MKKFSKLQLEIIKILEESNDMSLDSISAYMNVRRLSVAKSIKSLLNNNFVNCNDEKYSLSTKFIERDSKISRILDVLKDTDVSELDVAYETQEEISTTAVLLEFMYQTKLVNRKKKNNLFIYSIWENQ